MRTRLGALAAVAALVTTAFAGSALADPGDVPVPGSRAAAAGQDAMADRAEAALADVEAIFAGTPAGSRAAAAAPGREATLALRDLFRLKDSLRGADRVRALAALSRPDDSRNDGPDFPKYGLANSKKTCALNICVHWATSGIHAPDLTDANTNGKPDYVDIAKSTLQGIHNSYRNAGYKGPKKDKSSTNNGGNAKTDIYLADIGDDDLYGYCTSDDPSGSSYDISAYCVLDDDYAPAQFPSNTPLENLQVTAAHEYFHAVQYAYDAFDDGWFLEASATWAEDELYDDVNDNLFYLDDGQLANPNVPLDFFQNGGLFHYGNWIFLRWLTEYFPAETAGMPTIMRKLWDKVDAANSTDPDMYAIQAIKAELASRNKGFPAMYALYADAMRRQTSFSEGVENNYPVKPVVADVPVTIANPTTGQVASTMHHLTSATWRVFPEAGMTDPTWQLKVSVNMPDKVKGSAAIVTAYTEDGFAIITPVTLNTSGGGSATVDFNDTDIKHVEVTLVNASTRFKCWVNNNSPISCLGSAKDDSNTFTGKFTATASVG